MTMLFAGIDFPSRFEQDNFTLRRTTGHNMFDPESLISGAEIQAGMTFTNSKRSWVSEAHYLKAVTGNLNTDEVLLTAPRVCMMPGCDHSPKVIIPNRLEAFYELGLDTLDLAD